jgi:hypothetical protein
MRARFIALFISCLSLSAAMGQSAGNGTVKGFLRSKPDNQPLPFSAVMLQNPKDSSVAYSAVSNDKGFFQISGIADGEYRFVATYLGYAPIERNISISRGARTQDLAIIDMEDAGITLNQVTVKEDRIPVTVKQDTLEFDASAYKLRDNAVVEDILKRLPGVEVGADGSIKAMGENVTEITVDGQPFFGSDPKLATRNLPADIVSKIQIHEKKSDQAQFTGIDDGNTKKAINITLKKDKNEGVFGRITAGGGQTAANDLGTRFSLNGNVNRFRGKERVSLLGSGNNVNDLGFSFSDLMTSFGGGGQPGEGGGGLSDLLGGGGGSTMRMMQGGRGGLSGALTGAGSAGITTAYAGGLNYRNEWGGGKLKFNSSYFGSQSNTVNDEERLRQTILEDGSFSKLDDGHSENERANHRLNMNLEYQIDSSRSLIFRPTLTYSKQNALSDNVYESVNFENALLNDGSTLTRSDNTRPALSGNLLYRQRLRKAGRTISINLTGSYNDQDTEQLNQSDNRFYLPGGALLSDSSFNQLSFQQSINERLGARVAYTEPLGKNKFLELNYDFNNNFQNSDRVTYDFNELTGGYDIVNDVFSNNFKNTFTTHQGGFNYRYQKLKFDYTLGMSVQESNISSESPEQQSAFSRSFLNFFPVAQFNYNFSQSKRLRFNYRGNARNPSVSQLQPVPDVSNPQSIRLGNPELSPEISHNVNLNFNNFNMSTMQSMFVSLRSTLTNNRIVNSTTITGRGQQTIIPVNTDGAWNASAFAAVGMPVIKKIKLNVNFNANFNYDHYANIFNGSENITNSLTTGGGLRFSLTPNEKFDATLGANVSFNKAEQSIQAQLNSEFMNYTASADFNWTLPLNFVIGSDARFTANRGGSSTFNQEAILWGAYVEKRFLKNNSGALRLQAYDLLNQNINVTRTVGDGYIEDVSTSILRQYFLLSFTYKFGKFAGQNMMPPGMRMMRF